jgi:hypothetical protein
MDAGVAGEAAREMEKVTRALFHARELVVGVDRARAALGLADRESYSALRTLVEQAEISAERVQDALRIAARPASQGNERS